MRNTPFKIIVIGGGISGLSAAFALQEESTINHIPIECTVLEKDARWGGKILTSKNHGLLIEGGPDSFLTTKPWARDFCRTLGLEDRLISTNAQHNQTFSFCRGALRELPQGLLAFRPQRVSSLVTSGLLSWSGMLRMGAERFWPGPRRDPGDETLGSFFRRRFGSEAFDHLIEPLVAGIYAGDADELSLSATFPRFKELEQKYGSVIKGMRAAQGQSSNPSKPGGKAPSLFMTLRGGLGELIDTVIPRLEQAGVHLRSGVSCERLRRTNKGLPPYQAVLSDGEVIPADAVILATPAFQSANLLRPSHSQIAQHLEQIPYASTATISLAYPIERVQDQIKGFGFVVPRKESRPLLAATWTSMKWAGRSGPGETLIRCYVGGRGRESFLQQDNQGLVECARRELEAMVGVKGAPNYWEVHRWDQGMPQYVLGHQERVAKLQTFLAQEPGLYIIGAGLFGIGIPDCIREGLRIGKAVINDVAKQDKPIFPSGETGPVNTSS